MPPKPPPTADRDSQSSSQGTSSAAGTLGVRELKNRISAVISEVREHRVEYVVTVHGEPAALLRPLDESEWNRLRRGRKEATLSELDSLAHRITQEWTTPASASELLDRERSSRTGPGFTE